MKRVLLTTGNLLDRFPIKNKNMNYAIKILEDEHRILSMAINDYKAWANHPEAYKDRTKKLSEIRKALNLLCK